MAINSVPLLRIIRFSSGIEPNADGYGKCSLVSTPIGRRSRESAVISSRALVTLGLIALGAGCSKPSSPPPVIAELAPPELVDQRGAAFDGATMAGKLWVTSFVFTHCRATCPRIIARMKELQSRVVDVPCASFLSVSVDPRNDTPTVIEDYMSKNGLDERNWRFVTGTERAIEDFVVAGFKVGYGRTQASPELTHSNSLALVDGRSRIRGYYSTDDEGMATLERDLRTLGRELPTRRCNAD